MNLLKKALIASGMASIALSPIAASAQTAPVVTRAAPVSSDDSDLRGASRGLIFGVAAVAAVVAAFFITRDDDDDAISR